MPGKLKIDFHPERIIRRAEAAAVIGLKRCGEALKADVANSVSEPGPDPSDPGDPPHYQSGELRAGLHYSVDARKLVMTLRNETPHAFDMEFGTINVLPRPHMRPALERMRRRGAGHYFRGTFGKH